MHLHLPYRFYFWLFLLLPWRVVAQNLVPNPDFEQRIKPACLYTRFGENINQYITDWYTPTGATPDIWSNDPVLSPNCPQVLGPFAIQPRSGRQCVGFYTYFAATTPYREYLQVKLKQPMRKGQTYRVGMYVTLLNTLHTLVRDAGGVRGNTATNNIGMYFSADSLVVREGSPFRYGRVLAASPQINYDNLLGETGDWTRIGQCFTAQQDYNYLTIGNFFDDQRTVFRALESGYTDQRGYYLVDDVSVELIPNPPAALALGRDTTLCAGQSVSFALRDTANTQYRWQDGSTLPRFTARTTGVYQVTATRGGCPFSDTVRVTVEPAIKLPADTTLCRGEELVLDATNTLNAYAWSTGSTESKITVATEGTYSVRIPSGNCLIADTVRVAVLDCPGMVPNVFTPNGDGKNDIFFVENVQTTPWQLIVFNRWGREVYQSNAYANDWDGSGLPTGLYYYRLRSSRLKRELKGWLELLR
ncbi:MAG: gliding motility-associated C-terminal domain-containing protein [Bacteroidetes bacterium]|nr:gliding motility-associated C-terminal domain-containing protein [Fibrella sp.]